MPDAIAPVLTTRQLIDEGWAIPEEKRLRPVRIIAVDPSGAGDEKTAITVSRREEWAHGEPYDADFRTQLILRFEAIMRQRADQTFDQLIAKLLALHRASLQDTDLGIISHHVFVIEANSMGWAVISHLRERIAKERVYGVTTVGTDTDRVSSTRGLIMPRKTALGDMRRRVALQQITCTKNCPGWNLLIDEMRTFVWKGARPEHLEGKTDDLVMAACHASWLGFRILPLRVRARLPEQVRKRVQHMGTVRVLKGAVNVAR